MINVQMIYDVIFPVDSETGRINTTKGKVLFIKTAYPFYRHYEDEVLVDCYDKLMDFFEKKPDIYSTVKQNPDNARLWYCPAHAIRYPDGPFKGMIGKL